MTRIGLNAGGLRSQALVLPGGTWNLICHSSSGAKCPDWESKQSFRLEEPYSGLYVVAGQGYSSVDPDVET